jgi:predicted transcriptional regulator
MKTRNKGRAPGMTSLTLSLPAELKKRLATLAKAQNRSASNYFVHVVAPLLERTGEATLRVAEAAQAWGEEQTNASGSKKDKAKG